MLEFSTGHRQNATTQRLNLKKKDTCVLKFVLLLPSVSKFHFVCNNNTRRSLKAQAAAMASDEHSGVRVFPMKMNHFHFPEDFIGQKRLSFL
jgi:hypothetical protein